MPLGTLDRRAPSFVRSGPSALAQAVLYGALALFLMVSDARFQFTEPLRKAVATALYPLQWLMLQPVVVFHESSRYFQDLRQAQTESDSARSAMVQLAQRASQAEQLLEENARLRSLLGVRARLETPSRAAQILYNTADPYTRRVVIDQGQANGIVVGSPVVDESGRYLGVVSANRLLQMVLPKAAFMERSGIDSLPFVKDTLADFRERWREVASTPVLECLDTDLETVTPETSIAETLLSLYHNRTSLPVVDATTMRLVGIVSHWSAGAAMVGEGSP